MVDCAWPSAVRGFNPKRLPDALLRLAFQLVFLAVRIRETFTHIPGDRRALRERGGITARRFASPLAQTADALHHAANKRAGRAPHVQRGTLHSRRNIFTQPSSSLSPKSVNFPPT